MTEPMLNKLECAHMLEYLNELGAKSIKIIYSGSGDSGEIDEVNVEFEKKKVVNKKGQLVVPKDPVIDGWDDMETKLKVWTYHRLENEDDWYNNDGGDGEITIDVKTGKYKLHHGVTHTETKYQDSSGNLKKELTDF